MNKRRIYTVQNIVKRLKRANLGASLHADVTLSKDEANEEAKAIALLQSRGYVVTSAIYVDTWLVTPLEEMLSDNPNRQKAAFSMSYQQE